MILFISSYGKKVLYSIVLVLYPDIHGLPLFFMQVIAT